MEGCIYCKIIKGELPSKKVYEDDDLLAFEDINPAAPEHVLLIPKKHIATLNDVTEQDTQLLGKLFTTAKNIAADRKLSIDGYRLVMNCMAGAGQSVFHIHLHILGGRIFTWPPG
jgi:histidine triad (HIT) family protein